MNYDLELVPTSALLAEVFNRDAMQVISVDAAYSTNDFNNEEIQKYTDRDLRRQLGMYIKKGFFDLSEKPGNSKDKISKTMEIYVCKHPTDVKKNESSGR